MRINTRFTVAIHVLALIALNDGAPVTSEMMAASVGNHPVVIRQVMSALKKAGLVETRSGSPGGQLARPQEEITLRDIYRAVRGSRSEDLTLFELHPSPSRNCPVGRNIKTVLTGPLTRAQWAMENALKDCSLKDITAQLAQRYALEQTI